MAGAENIENAVQSEPERNPSCSVIAEINQAKKLLLLAQEARESDKRFTQERSMTLGRRDKERLKPVWGL